MNLKKHRGISPDTLKYIALITMLIDHISTGLIVFYIQRPRNDGMTGVLPEAEFRLFQLSGFMNDVGRIAFPIFAYQLVQGFIYTKSRLKYALNLLIFAIISEIPFDMCFFRKPFYFGHQNVMFELLAGIVLLCVLEYVNKNICDIDFAYDADVWKMPVLNKISAILLDTAISLLFMFPAQLLHFDYGGKGIVLIASFYILYRNREIMSFVCPVLFIASFYPVNFLFNHASSGAALESLTNEIPSCISFFLIYFDNGIRKIKGRRKYLFYAFYPAHLTILFIIRYLISIYAIISVLVK